VAGLWACWSHMIQLAPSTQALRGSVQTYMYVHSWGVGLSASVSNDQYPAIMGLSTDHLGSVKMKLAIATRSLKKTGHVPVGRPGQPGQARLGMGVL
jgi:hypothetical protein